MRETTICSICLEPIYNFICIDCFAEQVKEFLPRSLREEFESFHEKLKKTFANDENKEMCIKCRDVKETSICPFCYNKEIFFWILKKDKNLAERFVKIFNFNFMESTYEESIKVKDWVPIIITEKEREYDINFCEICGQQAELAEKEGRFVCESCSEEI
jgi:hypothetical protein